MKVVTVILFVFGIQYLQAQNIVWQKEYKIQSWIGILKTIETPNKDFLIAAHSGNTNNKNDGGNLIILKLDQAGNLMKTKVLDTTSFSAPYSLTESKKKGVYTLLYYAKSDGILVELDSDANILYMEQLNSDANFTNIISLRDGGGLLIGKLKTSQFKNKMVMMRYDRNHRYIWRDTFETGGSGQIEAVLENRAGQLIVGGSCTSKRAYYFLMRLDSGGKVLSYKPDYSDTGMNISRHYNTIIERENGYYAIVNRQSTFENFLFCCYLDTSGALIGEKVLSYDLEHRGYEIRVGKDTSVYILTGDGLSATITLSKTTISPFIDHPWEMKLEEMIPITKDSGWRSTGVYEVQDLILTSVGEIVGVWLRYELDAGRFNSPDSLKIAKINGDWPTAIQKFNLQEGKIYPNPVSDVLHYSHPNLSPNDKLYMEIRDVQGRLIYKVKISNAASENIDVANLQKGMYFYRVYSTEKSYSTGKFIKH